MNAPARVIQQICSFPIEILMHVARLQLQRVTNRAEAARWSRSSQAADLKCFDLEPGIPW
jgi:hypothetical protein